MITTLSVMSKYDTTRDVPILELLDSELDLYLSLTNLYTLEFSPPKSVPFRMLTQKILRIVMLPMRLTRLLFTVFSAF